MRKNTNFKNILLCLIVSIMVITTSVSYAYWKSGIEGNEQDKELNINIGAGSSYLTTVSLEEGTHVGNSKRLVPHNRPADPLTEVNEIKFVVNVTWDNVESSSSDTAFQSTEGVLTVECERIFTDTDEFLGVTGYSGKLLFICEPNAPYYAINGMETVTVTITIKLNEPLNKEQYDKIAGKNVKFTLNFAIVSPDDVYIP